METGLESRPLARLFVSLCLRVAPSFVRGREAGIGPHPPPIEAGCACLPLCWSVALIARLLAAIIINHFLEHVATCRALEIKKSKHLFRFPGWLYSRPGSTVRKIALG